MLQRKKVAGRRSAKCRFSGYIITAFATVLLHTSALSAPTDCATRPTWCQAGYVCQPSSCDAEQTRTILEQEVEIADLQVKVLRAGKVKRVHFDFGCGPGIAGVVTEDLSTRLVPTPLACTVNLAFRFGSKTPP